MFIEKLIYLKVMYKDEDSKCCAYKIGYLKQKTFLNFLSKEDVI